MRQSVQQTSVDPKGRLDILLLRLGEIVTRKVEKVLGPNVNIWDGPGGLREVAELKLSELGLAGQIMTPKQIAEQLGVIGRKKRRLR
jgi:hypothetical protein